MSGKRSIQTVTHTDSCVQTDQVIVVDQEELREEIKTALKKLSIEECEPESVSDTDSTLDSEDF